MSWFRIDDTLAAHPKARRAGLHALGLWTVAGSWSSQQLTEGFVPAWFADTWPQGRKLAAALVKADLWRPVEDPEPGWVFHDWTDQNPTADQERDRRAKARERQKRAREKSAEMREQRRDRSATDTRESRATSRVTDGVSHGPPVPTRPDPSHLPTEGDHGEDFWRGATDPNTGTTPPPRRCPTHFTDPTPPACGACKDARIAADAWTAPTPLRLVAPLNRCLIHDVSYERICAGCRADQIGDTA